MADASRMILVSPGIRRLAQSAPRAFLALPPDILQRSEGCTQQRLCVSSSGCPTQLPPFDLGLMVRRCPCGALYIPTVGFFDSEQIAARAVQRSKARGQVGQKKWRILARDGHACRLCSSRSRLHIHHIVPLFCFGSNALVNLITVCFTCHTTGGLHA